MYYYNMVRIAGSNKSAKPNKGSSSKGNIYCEKKVLAQKTNLKSIFCISKERTFMQKKVRGDHAPSF